MSPNALAKIMNAFFETHSFNTETNWRHIPLTGEDPDEVATKTLPVVSLKFNPNHEPAGSPVGGEFAPANGGTGTPATPPAKPRKPGKHTIIGQGTKKTSEEYSRLRVDAIEVLNKLGMEDQKLEFTFGEGKPITELASIGVNATEAAHFSGRTSWTVQEGIRQYKDGTISINLDRVNHNNIAEVVRHEALHARFHYVQLSSQRIDTFIDKNLEGLHREGRTVSQYASQWWQHAFTYRSPSTGEPLRHDVRTAVNESLAEYHAKQALGVSPVYSKLNGIVESVWSKRK